MAVTLLYSSSDVSQKSHKFCVIKILCYWIPLEVGVNYKEWPTREGELGGLNSMITTLYFPYIQGVSKKNVRMFVC